MINGLSFEEEEQKKVPFFLFFGQIAKGGEEKGQSFRGVRPYSSVCFGSPRAPEMTYSYRQE